MTTFTAVAAAVQPFLDITTWSEPTPGVRFTSGKTLYVESLHDGSWCGRFWSADGRINVSGEGWAEPAFQLSVDQRALSPRWRWVASQELPPTQRGARHQRIELAHDEQALTVWVHTLVDGTPVLQRWLEIENRSAQPVALGAVLPWTGRLWPGRVFSLGVYTQDIWACEGWFDWSTLGEGSTQIRCDKGQGFDDPFFIVRCEVTGEYFIGHLAWSANWVMDFRRDEQGLRCQIGPDAVPVQRVLAPGERVTTPTVHLGHLSGALDDAVQAMHDHLRRTVMAVPDPARAHRIQYLVPADQGYYRPFDEESALKCVEVAAAIGAELFILDAYWWDITPDWVPSPTRFPRGLEPIVERVRSQGMLFGLYVETEGGRGRIRESAVYQAHPDWFGPKGILNLTIPAAAAWMEAEICRLIDQYDLDLYRLDYNPQFTYDGPTTVRDGLVENNYWRYYAVFYDLYERIARKYPRLILQQCAAGGARNDLGTAARFHETYLTDGLSLPRELQIYSGLTLGLPPEKLLILHGADGGQGMGKPQNLDTILRLSYTTSIPQIFVGAVAPSVAELSPQRRERFLHYGRIYREFIRPLLPTCRVYHHAPANAHAGVDDGPWFAMEYAAPDRSRGWATVVRMRNGAGDRFVHKYPNEVRDDSGPVAGQLYREERYLLYPRGLDPGRTYRVTFDSLQSVVTVDGLSLVREGLPLRLENVGQSELLLFEAL